MTLHPITVVDQVLAEYREHLRTEFRARDPKLRAALEEALDRPRFLAQEPFYQAHRPFKEGRPWRDLGLDTRLAQVLEKRTGSKTAYLHQSEAISHLTGPKAGPLVVTTGTGSGKTECFLLPVIQNAIEDSTRFRRAGLTALLVYPMNALANDQEERIRGILSDSGHTHVRVARYDRSTPEKDREQLRRNPPHILLTNYVMLEYLLIRPADRGPLFENHRCRFIVLDEVHSYRGSLGANIALLYRRLVTHLKNAEQSWSVEEREDPARFPTVLPVATSATIKSIEETAEGDGRSIEELKSLRDEAVQDFLGKLTGITKDQFRVVGEEMRDLVIPAGARWTPAPAEVGEIDIRKPESIRATLCQLSGSKPSTELGEAAERTAILWFLNDEIARKPHSISSIVELIRERVAERREADPEALRREVEAALVAGAALPDGTSGALRLRVHRFVRGGWRFHRCVDRACARLYPMGEQSCACGKRTAPLYLCRSCGADVLRFRDEGEGAVAALIPNDSRSNENEWVLYDLGSGAEEDDDEDAAAALADHAGEKEMKGRATIRGSFDPASCSFSSTEDDYPRRVILAPARNRCLVCGFLAGGGSVLTPVALGTSAALRVMAEGVTEALAAQHAGLADHDGKERLLIFADSRQDAAHQARFISYAGRYDRMRRRLVRALETTGRPLRIDEAVQKLLLRALERRDNPHTGSQDDIEFINRAVRERAEAWEEAPLLDDLSVSAGYRATVFNLGLVGVRYHKLDGWIEKRGGLLAEDLGISISDLLHLCRCLLDEMRRRMALSRALLQYHPANPSCPTQFRDDVDWERRLKQPTGFPCEKNGTVVTSIPQTDMPDGVRIQNVWRQPKRGGARPVIERRFRTLLDRMGGGEPTEERLVDILKFLSRDDGFLKAVELHGFRQSRKLLQVNADVVELELVAAADRRTCTICSLRLPWAEVGSPCPNCQGTMQAWPAEEVERSRYVQRIRKSNLLPLVAAEHTAQVTGDERIDLETRFKAPASVAPLNVLACSPTLEMGIDVGGLDAVAMRNVPPRPDNYAQRGGRAGRRSRVGVVLAYARSTPHDAYFYDRPAEMIAGEVPAPAIGLGNRDVILRHLHAIALGGAEPGLAGRMEEYVDIKGELKQEPVNDLISAVEARFKTATDLARQAWGPDVLEPAGLNEPGMLEAALAELPNRIRDLFTRVCYQIQQLQKTIDTWNDLGRGDRSAMHAMDLKRKLLGIRSEKDERKGEADDRTSGHPMRRFAEFGILPGYEFPTEPATLRLWGDPNEEAPITVERRFGIAQYQPDARAHARRHRWRVIGLDPASPWNPRSEEAGWVYVRCGSCDLRYGAQEHAECPRCTSDKTKVGNLPGYEFGGFLATRDDTPVLEEEDRYSIASLVRSHPQRNGRPISRHRLATGWTAELRQEEEIRWVNESRKPTPEDLKKLGPAFLLHDEARGFHLCPGCGRSLTVPDEKKRKGHKKLQRSETKDPYGHAPGCSRFGEPPKALAITCRSLATTLRIPVPLPQDFDEGAYQEWGQSLGFSLRTGMRHLYMLDGREIEFVLEPMWKVHAEAGEQLWGALTFIDPSVGGSGFLDRASRELHLVAARTLEHLDHPDCQTACYRCLKAYQNQRFHDSLMWPRVVPDLEQIRERAPEAIAWSAVDRSDPSAWLEAYAAGVGSPLELRFLRLFEEHRLDVEKQVPVAADEGGPAISVADFVMKGSKVAIYIDGAGFHRGERLRRDRFIRERLRGGSAGWEVVAYTATDLARGPQIVSELRAVAGDTRYSK